MQNIQRILKAKIGNIENVPVDVLDKINKINFIMKGDGLKSVFFFFYGFVKKVSGNLLG